MSGKTAVLVDGPVSISVVTFEESSEPEAVIRAVADAATGGVGREALVVLAMERWDKGAVEALRSTFGDSVLSVYDATVVGGVPRYDGPSPHGL